MLLDSWASIPAILLWRGFLGVETCAGVCVIIIKLVRVAVVGSCAVTYIVFCDLHSLHCCYAMCGMCKVHYSRVCTCVLLVLNIKATF